MWTALGDPRVVRGEKDKSYAMTQRTKSSMLISPGKEEGEKKARLMTHGTKSLIRNVCHLGHSQDKDINLITQKS